MAEQKKDQRESGLPGGGAGRKDDVHGSPIWPATGPRPTEEVPTRTPGEFVDSGPKGYEESGRSEIFYMPGEIDREDEKNKKRKD